MAKGDRDLTTGSVRWAVVGTSAPMVVGIFGVISVGLADAFFLGKVGQAQLAAVGFFFPVATAITSLSIGLSAGSNAALSQGIGRADGDGAVNRVAFHALGLGIAIGVITALVLWLLLNPIFSLLGATDRTLPEIRAYMGWWLMSFPLLVISMQLGAMFRAHGNAVTASIIMSGQSVFNIAIDPLLIFGMWGLPEMGTGGAGLATFLARLLAVLFGLAWALRSGHLTLCADPLKNLWTSARQILGVGLPAAFSNAINPMGMAAVTAAVATLGDAAVAGFGAATRIQTLALVPMLALSSGIGPVIGQNWGADRQDRAGGAMRFTFLLCILYGAALAAVLLLFGDVFAEAIASGEEDAQIATTYLHIAGLSLFGYGMMVTANAAMNARSRATVSMGLSLGRILLVYIPLAWALVGVMGFTGIAVAAAVANVAAALAALVAARWTGILPLDLPSVPGPSARPAE